VEVLEVPQWLLLLSNSSEKSTVPLGAAVATGCKAVKLWQLLRRNSTAMEVIKALFIKLS
jgi:hypothetical protein